MRQVTMKDIGGEVVKDNSDVHTLQDNAVWKQLST